MDDVMEALTLCWYVCVAAFMAWFAAFAPDPAPVLIRVTAAVGAVVALVFGWKFLRSKKWS